MKMISLRIGLLLSITWCCCSVNAGYTDCERPPTILHGKTELSVDDQGTVVIAIYTCENGYQVVGENEIYCNTDTDEWQVKEQLPICKLLNGDNAIVGEIERTDAAPAEPSVEITHEEIAQTSETVVQSNASVTNEIETDGDNVAQESEVDATEVDAAEVVPQQKRRRKGKHYEEDTTIDEAYASQLDLSCVGGTAISAPSIDNAIISKYNRRRKGDYVFLVAIYECYENHALENAESNRLYCSKGQWVGSRPVCVQIEGTDGDIENEIEEVGETDYGAETGDDNGDDVEGGDADRNDNQIEQHERHDDVSTAERPSSNENEIVQENVPTDVSSNAIEETNEIIPTQDVVVPRIDVPPTTTATADCAVNNGGCEQFCSTTGQAEIACSCADGYALDIDGAHCVEIPSSNADIEKIATNEIGETIPITQSPSVDLSPIKTCGEGFRMDATNNCIDIDECAEGSTGCQFCENSAGSFQCTCPDGYELGSDERTCKDIDECTAYSEFDYDEDRATTRSICSHECVNTDGAFICKCPENHHLHSDKRTCERDLCQHLGDDTKVKCSHECVDEAEGYRCKCPEGMELHSDAKTCVQVTIDLCGTENGGCSDICNTVNNQVVCDCVEGSTLSTDGRTCAAVNICGTNNGGCPQVCNAETNRCECFPGYETNDDGQTCTDVNECERSNGGCPQDCTNLDGGFECVCFAGFRKNENSFNQCDDINECEVNNGNCEHECQNTIGSYVCQCRSGYHNAGDQHRCVDVNECLTDNGKCSHTCINSLGGYQCTCPQGQFLVNDHLCDYQNECETDNGGCSHGCNFKNGVVNCSCPRGYRLDDTTKKNCEDIDECAALNNGGCEHTCVNLAGRHECKCNAGFQLGADQSTCIDVDECIENNGNCSLGNGMGTGMGICVNSPGSYFCACEAGYELANDKHTCRDVNECTDKIHDCSHECVNVPGTYECECPSGFRLSRDHFNCEDINECEVAGSCAVAGDCVNTVGSFHCKCPGGHERGPDGACIDIDECAIANGQCGQRCVNTPGSFKCECDSAAGFRLANDGKKCFNADPCAIKNGGCAHVCEPLNGRAQCYCYKGFELNLNDNSSCVDIDECVTDHGCHSKCVNTIGSYKCDCPSGFRLNDGNQCVDIDECEDIVNGGCSAQADCINFIGSFRCICPAGFKLGADQTSCNEIKDTCAAIAPPEHGDVRCTRSRHRTQLFYRTKCTIWCRDGFTLNGPSVKHCNGTEGTWDDTPTTCVPSTCSPLVRPTHGIISPPNCLSSSIHVGEMCQIQCPQGYQPIGADISVCQNSLEWSVERLDCSVIVTPPPPVLSRSSVGVESNSNQGKKQISQGEIHTQGHTVLEEDEHDNQIAQPSVRRIQTQNAAFLPHIKCPRDTTLVLPKGQSLIYIKLEQPKTNVNWHTHVDAQPAWAKHLQARLAAGVHRISFRARSPYAANVIEVCRTVITVKPATAAAVTSPVTPIGPAVSFCPGIIEVQLQPNERARIVHWKEPAFRSHYQLKQLFKTKPSGSQFAAGVHRITYIATDVNNQNARCDFTINIKPATPSRLVNPAVASYGGILADHESYLLCPNKPAMKLETAFPVQIPSGCFVKNIRLNLRGNTHRRRHALSSNNNFLKLYSSWNRPEARRFYW